MIFLTYLETVKSGHVCLMLSKQISPDQPTHIGTAMGFVADDESDENLSPFKKYKGRVNPDEQIISKILYSNVKVKHRTFEISEQESKKFLEILAEDSEIEYQLLFNNCKTYIMDVFKRIGIVDANNLGNLFIQRPGSKNNLLHSLSKDNFSCPLKEEYMEELNARINEFKQLFTSLAQEKTEKAELIKKIIDSLDDLQKNRFKIKTEVFNISPTMTTLRKDLDQLNHFSLEKQNVEDITEKVNAIINLTENFNRSTLQFRWNEPPQTAPRLYLNNFSELEKRSYVLRIKANELDNLLSCISENINKASNQFKSFSSIEYHELREIKNIIFSSQHELRRSKIINFHSSQDNEDSKTLISEHEKKINALINQLDNKLTKFSPKSSLGDFLIKFIYKILSYCNKRYDGKLVRSNAEDNLRLFRSTLKDISTLHGNKKNSLEK